MNTSATTYRAPQLHIRGRWRVGPAGTSSPVITPATGQTLDVLGHAGPADPGAVHTRKLSGRCPTCHVRCRSSYTQAWLRFLR